MPAAADTPAAAGTPAKRAIACTQAAKRHTPVTMCTPVTAVEVHRSTTPATAGTQSIHIYVQIAAGQKIAAVVRMSAETYTTARSAIYKQEQTEATVLHPVASKRHHSGTTVSYIGHQEARIRRFSESASESHFFPVSVSVSISALYTLCTVKYEASLSPFIFEPLQ